MSNPKPWSGPGLLLVSFTQRPTSSTPTEALEKWFAEEFVPGLLATGGVESASLYHAANPTYAKQNLLVYKIKDLAMVQAGALQKVASTSSQGFFAGTVDEHMASESWVYELVQCYEPKEQPNGPEPTIMLALMQPTPTGAPELERWYVDEHNEQMSKEPGWLRTTRYSLLAQFTNGGEKTGEYAFLAVHAFDEGNCLGKDVKPLEPMTEWTKKVLGEAEGIEAGVLERVRVFGES